MDNPIINLTRGVPPAEVFPITEIQECLEIALARDGGQILTYNFVPGYAPLRQIIAERMGVPVEQIFTGNGSLEIVNFLSAIFLGYQGIQSLPNRPPMTGRILYLSALARKLSAYLWKLTA